MRPSAPAKPYNRAGVWYLVRKVPKQFRAFDPRGVVLMTTNVAVASDPKGLHARRIVERLDAELLRYWQDRASGLNDARLKFEAAQTTARNLGLQYRTNEELAAGPIDEILRRVNLLVDRKALDDEEQVAAIVGTVQRPTIMLSGLVDEYATVQQSALETMSEFQQRKWRNPRKRAVKNFMDALGGDKALKELVREDALTFRRVMQERIKVEGLDIASANREMSSISRMLKSVDLTHQLGLQAVFAGLRIEGRVERQRMPFEADFVQSVIFATGAMDGLNRQARHLVYLIAETGMRPSEAAGLLPERILLDHPIPHVQVRPDGRILKTPQSARDIPLVGAALEVMKLNPTGFPRYRDKDSLSAIVNKFFGNHGMMPTDAESLYSLRHCFEDRLTAVEAPEKTVATLMGHKWHRPKYGAGPTLELKRKWLLSIALKPPAHYVPSSPPA